ncbi:hypothetical protein A2634_04105 [Candidatus Amesbacteria bacterium RIFCSPHIGHO2_01_FULL_48_32]|uniref:Uncharacterized protein n=1 Tax=Candidatus Amesbacteria bacterium RIFCSPLOWO2_01_FULL_48_25 TaxID=1797259 RepID=A0A1F4ZCD4_9BACT|nr:MAG: hypothetical protein A2634_04105 [Candidatus Amesbacteria bacterium RIFCSPHIGHO2_01_FULL_48_32]OGD03911.1 MAG: hypothetical protein A2989_04400 [Candidatus Amesbacteria bacterium RIFCSPLOWO2_01_FULL_48_25]HJZ05860.1 hypothetical protein [Patescibacteria group bacterium]
MAERRIVDEFDSKTGKPDVSVTPRNLIMEIRDLARKHDTAGLKELFEAYMRWEKSGNIGETEEQTKQRILENFEVYAYAADLGKKGNLGSWTLREVAGILGNPGPVRKFFRETMEFTPTRILYLGLGAS